MLINTEIVAQWQFLHWLCVTLFSEILIDQGVIVNKALIIPKWIWWIKVLLVQRRYEFLRYFVLWVETHRTRPIFFGVCMAQWTFIHKIFCDLSFICCNPWTNLKFLDSWWVISVNLTDCRGLLLDCWVSMILWPSQPWVVLCLSICLLFCLDNLHAAFVRRLSRNKCWFYLLGRQRIWRLRHCSIDVLLGSLFRVLLDCCLVL